MARTYNARSGHAWIVGQPKGMRLYNLRGYGNLWVPIAKGKVKIDGDKESKFGDNLKRTLKAASWRPNCFLSLLRAKTQITSVAEKACPQFNRS